MITFIRRLEALLDDNRLAFLVGYKEFDVRVRVDVNDEACETKQSIKMDADIDDFMEMRS